MIKNFESWHTGFQFQGYFWQLLQNFCYQKEFNLLEQEKLTRKIVPTVIASDHEIVFAWQQIFTCVFDIFLAHIFEGYINICLTYLEVPVSKMTTTSMLFIFLSLTAVNAAIKVNSDNNENLNNPFSFSYDSGKIKSNLTLFYRYFC